MMYTNFYMFLVAVFAALLTGDFVKGISFCNEDPLIWNYICKFCICSAVGQSFIFHTVSIFDPLVCSTITTTRKIVSVFLSIIYKGHVVSPIGWYGVALACFGVMGELHDKYQRRRTSRKTETCHDQDIRSKDSDME